MRIGLDFDNTLVRYDQVFSIEAKKLGVMPGNWSGSKQELRDELRTRTDGERLWKTLQGKVYGVGMGQAVLFPGVVSFLIRSRYKCNDVFIVSHKTEYGHFDSTMTPLRQTALAWMESRGFFDKSRFGLEKENVFFEGTRSEKVRQIARLNLDIFIDDLEEVFSEQGFPLIKKILFNPKAQGEHYDFHYTNWAEIGQDILGPMSDDECKKLTQTFCPEIIHSITRLSGSGNSRIFRVLSNSGSTYALKSYPDLLGDPRPRLRTEVTAYNFLEHLQLTPRAIASDEELNLALFEWVDADVPRVITTQHIDLALSFSKKLKELADDDHGEFHEASEACLSAIQLFSQIEERIWNLESVQNVELQSFLETSIKPLWDEIREWSELKWPADSFESNLTRLNQTLSPSDFGFHNSLERSDGSLCFVDFEYFGRDDPVKLIADFLWHPAMELKVAQKKYWLWGAFAIFGQDKEMRRRFRAAWPLYGLRWALIILNEFRQDGWQKRVHAKRELQYKREHTQRRQLEKAAEVCGRIRDEKLECPYV